MYPYHRSSVPRFPCFTCNLTCLILWNHLCSVILVVHGQFLIFFSFQISRLLATVFLLFSASGQSFLAVYCSDSLSSCHWAAFFHQASIGAHFHSQYSSANKGKHNSFNPMNCEVYLSLSLKIELF